MTTLRKGRATYVGISGKRRVSCRVVRVWPDGSADVQWSDGRKERIYSADCLRQ